MKPPLSILLTALLILGSLAPDVARGQPGFVTNRQAITPPSAGLFVGVNNFTEDPTIIDLNYAANDAIALAHLFVVELRMVLPENARLLLSGRPDETDHVHREKLRALEAAGVFPREATKVKILRSLAEVVGITQRPAGTPDTLRSDFLVVSMSSHGFLEAGTSYFIPQDGLLSDLTSMGINLKQSVEEKVREAGTSKKLILIDACRNELRNTGTRGIAGTRGEAFSKEFLETFQAAEGTMVFYSGSAGQVSYEDHTLQQGVFTHFLLEALGKNTPVAPDTLGLVRLGDVVAHVSRAVNQWTVNNNKSTRQAPFNAAGGGAAAIPLALSNQPAHLRLADQPSGTMVFIDDVHTATLDGADTLLTLPPGRLSLRLHKPPRIVPGTVPSALDTLAYIDHLAQIDLPPGGEVTVDQHPIADFGTVYLYISAPDKTPKATVTFHDLNTLHPLFTRAAPLLDLPLPAGDYEVRAEPEEKDIYGPLEFKLHIPQNEEIVSLTRMLEVIAAPLLPIIEPVFTGAFINDPIRIDPETRKLHLSYDLQGLAADTATVFNVALQYRYDIVGEHDYQTARAVEGDVGLQQIGPGKTIVWDIMTNIPDAHDPTFQKLIRLLVTPAAQPEDAQ